MRKFRVAFIPKLPAIFLTIVANSGIDFDFQRRL